MSTTTKKKSDNVGRRVLHTGLAVGVVALVSAGALRMSPSMFAVSYLQPAATSTPPSLQTESAVPGVVHLPTPVPLRAIYMSQCAVGSLGFRKELVDFIKSSGLNAVVIDVKDYSGGIGFPTDDPALAPYVSKSCGAKDMQEFVKELHADNIYVIARITVFQDPMYAKAHPELAVKTKEGGVWKNYGGLAFIDVGARPFWDYIVELGRVAYRDIGFDELNFDYIRFPSDGNLADASFTLDAGTTKAEALEEFFRYLSAELKPSGVVLSADLFGYTTVHSDDLGIGQVLERALPYFDYIDPMVYPSHYINGFDGIKNVNADPYDVVHYSLAQAVLRAAQATTTVEALAETPITRTVVVPATATEATTTKEVATGVYRKAVYPASIIRPWLQGFDYPVVYTPEMVQAQIQATYDVGLQSYLVWDAANKYTALRQVLKENATTTAAN